MTRDEITTLLKRSKNPLQTYHKGFLEHQTQVNFQRYQFRERAMAEEKEIVKELWERKRSR